MKPWWVEAATLDARYSFRRSGKTLSGAKDLLDLPRCDLDLGLLLLLGGGHPLFGEGSSLSGGGGAFGVRGPALSVGRSCTQMDIVLQIRECGRSGQHVREVGADGQS